jgi:hypothetical protein
MNLQKLDQFTSGDGRPILEDGCLSEVKRILQTIQDYQKVKQICQGTFTTSYEDFSLAEVMNSVKSSIETQF